METQSNSYNFKPKIGIKEASILVEKLYGVKCENINELIAYDDKNYKVKLKLISNEYIVKTCPDGYVLKVTNSLDSKNIVLFDMQINVLLFLAKKGIKCPIPVQNIEGKYYSLEEIQGQQHIVRLLEFQAGKIFCEVDLNNFLFYRMGQFIANLDNILKEFKYNKITNHNNVWQLSSVPNIKQYLYCIKCPNKKKLIEEIISSFENNVLKQHEILAKGLIHGDFNEQNIVVIQNDNSVWDIKAVLDFGDMHIACYLFELAITITYAIVHSRNIEVGGYVIAGYSNIREIPLIEKKLLKICICARLVQSLVLGLYAFNQDPSNKYVLTTQENGWNILYKLWSHSSNELLEYWDNIAKNYKP